MIVPSDVSSRWRNPADYAYTDTSAREDFAWDFLRRNGDYRQAAADVAAVQAADSLFGTVHVIDVTNAEAAAEWGLHAFETADRPPPAAAVFWRSDFNPNVLPVKACKVSNRCDDAFDIQCLKGRVTVLRLGGELEQVLIDDGHHCIQLEVRGRSLLGGPVFLHCNIRDFENAEPKILTLQRLVAFRKLGRFPHFLFRPERRGPRWAIALRALDAARAGASPRDIADALFGEDRVSTDWNGQSDYLRSRIRRAIAAGTSLANGGYLALLRGARRAYEQHLLLRREHR